MIEDDLPWSCSYLSTYLSIISTSNSYTSKNWWRDLNKQQLGVLCTDCNESILGVSNFLSIFKFQLDLPSIHLTFHKFVHALCLYAYLKWPSWWSHTHTCHTWTFPASLCSFHCSLHSFPGPPPSHCPFHFRCEKLLKYVLCIWSNFRAIFHV